MGRQDTEHEVSGVRREQHTIVTAVIGIVLIVVIGIVIFMVAK